MQRYGQRVAFVTAADGAWCRLFCPRRHSHASGCSATSD